VDPSLYATKAGVTKGKLKPVHEARPRDKMGKIVEVGGTVALGSGGQGTVLASAGGGRVRVRRTDGTEVVIDATQTTLIRGAATNAQRATGPDGLQAALADEQAAGGDPLLPPGDRDDAAAETDADEALDRPVGAEPAPDATPDGAIAHLATPTGDQQAWLQMEDGVPVGYFSPNAADPASTLRYDDGGAWADAVDAVGMAPVDGAEDLAVGPTAPTVAGFESDPSLPPATPPMPAPTPEPSDLPAAAGAPSRGFGGPGTVSPENLSRLLLDGLDQVPNAVAQAKAESVAQIVARMADVPDDVVLKTDALDRLSRVESGQVVLLRIPKPGVLPSPAPTYGEQLTQWVYREVDDVRFQALLRSDAAPPPDLEIVTAEQWRAWARSARIADALSLWAAGSGGANADALALQEAAADLFGMEVYAPAPALDEVPELRSQVEEALDADREFYDALLLAMYQATQDRLREAQVMEIELFRGWRTPDGTPEWAVEQTTEELPVRPLSSWSADRLLVGGYARGNGFELGYVTSAVFPAERILAFPRTGFGSLRASEFVVLAGPGEVSVHEATEADGPAIAQTWTPPVDEDELPGHGDTAEADPTDPAVVAPGLLRDAEELTAAIAAADTDARRFALMGRAATMGLAELIPEAWQADGTLLPVDSPDTAQRGPDGRLLPLDEQLLGERLAAVEDAIAAAKAAGLETTHTQSLDGEGEVWPEDRMVAHAEIVDAVWATAANVPDDGKALLIGTLPGGHVTEVLATPRAGIDPTAYLTINLDDIKTIMAARDLVPDVPDAGVELSAMERAPLIHDEAVHLAGLIAARAYAERRNVAWMLAMADQGTVENLVGRLRAAGYGEVVAIFVDVPVQAAIDRAAIAYREAMEDMRNGEGLGGRYLPAATLSALNSTEFTSLPRLNFENARDSFDDWQVWDDSIEGRAPELVYYRGAPNLEQLTEAARTGTVPQTKGLPGTSAALTALLRREGLTRRPRSSTTRPAITGRTR
jgi:hypothetical protein